MRRIAFLLGAIALLAAGGAVAAFAGGEHPPPPIKVFVCKYVGTPGVDERLQTGGNPIDVSVNAIPNYQGVGSYFADAQGRSYVIGPEHAANEHVDEPSADHCPQPEHPTDVCPNLEGNQSQVPDGYTLVDGHCVQIPPPPIDVCPNLEGNQAQVPPGMVLVNGHCVTPPPPPNTTGDAQVICDGNVYRLSGHVDGQAADSVSPATLPGSTKGVTEVVVTRGDTSVRTTVTTNGDCGSSPPPTTTTTTTTTPPVTTQPPTTTTPPATTPTPPKAKPPVKPKPKPAPPKKQQKPKHKTTAVKHAHVCKPLANGTKRAWFKGGNGMPAGCYPIVQGSY